MDASLTFSNLLKNAASCSEKHLHTALNGMEVSPCQASILLQVSGKTTMSSLSKALCCHKSNISQIVDVLVERDVILRVPSKEDRRVSHLKLTVKGKKLLSEAHAVMRKVAEQCLAIYSPQERRILEQLLKKYVREHA